MLSDLSTLLHQTRRLVVYEPTAALPAAPHPLLVIELGFRLELDPTQPYGFDVEKTVPCDYWLREQLHRFDPDLLQTVLRTTVAALKQEIPGLSETVAAARQAHLCLGARE